MADDERPDDQLRRLAASQHGLVTREQVLGTGLSRQSLERRLKSRRLQKLGWHVYLLGGAEPSWKQLALAACLDHGPYAALSHASAAKAVGIELQVGPELHVTVPAPMSDRRRTEGVIVHRSRRF